MHTLCDTGPGCGGGWYAGSSVPSTVWHGPGSGGPDHQSNRRGSDGHPDWRTPGRLGTGPVRERRGCHHGQPGYFSFIWMMAPKCCCDNPTVPLAVTLKMGPIKATVSVLLHFSVMIDCTVVLCLKDRFTFFLQTKCSLFPSIIPLSCCCDEGNHTHSPIWS